MNVDPNQSNGSNTDGHKPSKDPRVDITITPLEGLMPPPRSAAGYRVRDLFRKATPDAYDEIGNILYNTESRPVRSYIGYLTAVELSPKTIPLALDILRFRSLHATQEFLTILAQREYGAFMLGDAPSLKGEVFSDLRVKLADLAVSPECYFMQKDWERHAAEIQGLTTYPITILRACAGREVEPVLVAAATRGGIDEEMNRRALDLLLLREESNPSRRVLSPEHVQAIASVTDDLLRGPFNLMQVVQLVDMWLSKEEKQASAAELEIRDGLVRQWNDYRSSEWSASAGDAPKVFDTLRLLRHFGDLDSRRALDDAAKDGHTGISLFSRLCRSGGAAEDVAAVSAALEASAPIADTLMALRVFGCRISPQVDAKLWPVFNDYINRTWGSEVVAPESHQADVAQRLVVLQNMLRRFYSERFDTPFLEQIFSAVGSENKAMATVAVNTFAQAVKIDRIPPPTFYDRPEKLGPLQAAIQILCKAGREKGNDAALQLAQGIQELFILRGPAAYGFELAETPNASSPA